MGLVSAMAAVPAMVACCMVAVVAARGFIVAGCPLQVSANWVNSRRVVTRKVCSKKEAGCIFEWFNLCKVNPKKTAVNTT